MKKKKKNTKNGELITLDKTFLQHYCPSAKKRNEKRSDHCKYSFFHYLLAT